MALPAIYPLVRQLLAKSEQVQPPTNLESIIAIWPGLHVSAEDMDGEAYILDLGIQGTELFLKKDSYPQRQRFSLAHELGHIVLRDKGIGFSGREQSPRDKQLERWCDTFAGELLMPSDWIMRSLSAPSDPDAIDFVMKLPGIYDVSRESMFIRLAELGIMNLAVVERKGQWTKITRTFRNRRTQNGLPLDLPRVVKDLPNDSHTRIQEDQFFRYYTRLTERSALTTKWLVVAVIKTASQAESTHVAAETLR